MSVTEERIQEHLPGKRWTAPPSGADVSDVAQWPASLSLGLSGGDFGTKITNSRHQGPLYVQKPFYPEGPDCAHIYLLHPPGGVVSGDTLNIDILLDDRAKALVTVPGASRLYRARVDCGDQKPLPQRIVNQLNIANDSSLEWLPMETIVFDGASIELVTEIKLDTRAHFCAWEIICLGLPASDAPFLTGDMYQNFSVHQNDTPLFIDRMRIDASSGYMTASCGLQEQPVFGTLLAGPYSEEVLSEQIELLDKQLTQLDHYRCVSITTIHGLIILRYLGDSTDKAKQLFVRAWSQIRPDLIGREAVAPRIWST